jgi:hypothetical protein
LKGGGAIHLYQSGEVDDGDDPTPVAILVDADAPANTASLGRSSVIDCFRIEWEVRQDPDEFPLASGVTSELQELLRSKLGGVPPAVEPPVDGARFLGQIAEEPCGLNFGGLLLTLWETPDHSLVCELI